ncbi:hypothetical protein KC19_6G095000 [Ceratodon purpureus]|uniref:Uncharacterized protein n=1 Tax=Ceratodon purpureus TaxID=3225 RepID=A0A8T0HH53_CERPU|nr:hypothetical protein KC19_6G095000 [Ceratodon purpureus]
MICEISLKEGEDFSEIEPRVVIPEVFLFMFEDKVSGLVFSDLRMCMLSSRWKATRRLKWKGMLWHLRGRNKPVCLLNQIINGGASEDMYCHLRTYKCMHTWIYSE